MYDRIRTELWKWLPGNPGAVKWIAALCIVVGSGLILAGCTYSEKRMMKPGLLSPTLGPMLYKEEGSLILMTAGVNATARTSSERPATWRPRARNRSTRRQRG